MDLRVDVLSLPRLRPAPLKRAATEVVAYSHQLVVQMSMPVKNRLFLSPAEHEVPTVYHFIFWSLGSVIC